MVTDEGASTAPSIKKDDAPLRELIESGSEISGALVGTALGLLGGPTGALGGAAAGVVLTRLLKRVGADIKRRLLGPREEARVGMTVALIAVRADRLLREGERPRGDGFFEPDESERPAAEEILEGVLLKARDSYQEKKLPLLANLYTSIAFLEEISPSQANHLVVLASRLTYRQLVAMAVALDEATKPQLRQSDYRGDAAAIKRLGMDGQALITEIYDLYQQGLISDATGSAWISVADVNPGAMRPQGSGFVLAQAMDVSSAVPQKDIQGVRALLS
jgi:hypothetical protein